MVEFWGIFVVFSACAAVQLTESRIQHAYSPSYLSASDELTDLSNSISDSSKDVGDSATYEFGNAFEVATDTLSDSEQETQTNSPQHVAHSTETEAESETESDADAESTTLSSTASEQRLSLSERRQELYDFINNAMSEYTKNYVGKTRDAIKEVIVELEATAEKSDALKDALFEIKATLKELEAFDIESNDLTEASSIVYDVNEALDWPANQPPELDAALEKVGWLDMRIKLDDETVEIVKEFRKKLNNFVATLTPWERLREADLIYLNRRFNEDTSDDGWDLFDDIWTYFD